MRVKAIRALDGWIGRQNPKEAVLLGKKYHIVNWLKNSYTRLLQQQTLTANELNASPFSIDWETIARLLSVREAIRVSKQESSGVYAALHYHIRIVPCEHFFSYSKRTCEDHRNCTKINFSTPFNSAKMP